MNSRADDMFDKLGYEKYETVTKHKYYLTNNEEDLLIICFNLRTKRITIDCRGEALDICDLQAINQKILELGWGNPIIEDGRDVYESD